MNYNHEGTKTQRNTKNSLCIFVTSSLSGAETIANYEI